MNPADNWMVEKARQETSNTLKNWIWDEVTCGIPIPGCISIEACRAVLIERGESGRGWHHT